MATCFVIQPFDSGAFDDRFVQVLTPAIKSADLEAYRVDRDPNAEILIEAIESGIRTATVCLAEITLDNPNVWFELGFALALGKPVVLVCSQDRRKFPFDIQHRSVITYDTQNPNDFVDLQTRITERIRALIRKSETLQQLSDSDQVAPIAGLGQNELTVLAIVAGEVASSKGAVNVHATRMDAERNGLTKIGFAIALRKVLTKGLLAEVKEPDYNGNDLESLRVTGDSWSWIEANEQLFLLRRDPQNSAIDFSAESDDEIPF